MVSTKSAKNMRNIETMANVSTFIGVNEYMLQRAKCRSAKVVCKSMLGPSLTYRFFEVMCWPLKDLNASQNRYQNHE